MEERRCWKQKVSNVLDQLPKRLQHRAKDMPHEIMYAPDRESVLQEIGHFLKEFEARYPKAVETLVKDQDQLFTFFDYPAQRWIHLRTTNPIESPSATGQSTDQEDQGGGGSRKAGLAMAHKLLLAADKRWRRVNAPHLVALARASVTFPNGEAEMFQPERLDDSRLFPQTPSILAAGDMLIPSI